MDDEDKPIIIDAGSDSLQAGFAGDDLPQTIFPSIVGELINDDIEEEDLEIKDFYVGEDIDRYREYLTITTPISNGKVESWDHVEKMWQYCFDALEVDVEDHNVLITERPRGMKDYKEKAATILFESFDVPALYISLQPTLSLYASGRTTGISIDSGCGPTHIVPIYEGYALSHAGELLAIGGRDATKYMMQMLAEDRGFDATIPNAKKSIREMKESLCVVVNNFGDAIENNTEEQEYALPDGTMVTVGQELFKCPEVFFNPLIMDHDQEGVHSLTLSAIMKCDTDIRRDLWANIVLSGGNTLFTNFDTRLEAELSNIAPRVVKPHVNALSERLYSVWIGGSILSALSSFQEMWVEREDYDEYGANIVYQKCT